MMRYGSTYASTKETEHSSLSTTTMESLGYSPTGESKNSMVTSFLTSGRKVITRAKTFISMNFAADVKMRPTRCLPLLKKLTGMRQS